MRHRSTVLLVIAALLALVPMISSTREQAACSVASQQSEDSILATIVGGGSACRDGLPQPKPWERLVTWLAVGFGVAGLAFAAVAHRERRRERDLLRAVGVNVSETDLPLE